MALENIAEIETSLGIEAGKLTEMITSEENHTIDLSSKVILDRSAYDERLANIKKESATIAIEMAVKEQRNNLGFVILYIPIIKVKTTISKGRRLYQWWNFIILLM